MVYASATDSRRWALGGAMRRGSRRLAMSGSIATSLTAASSPAPLLALGHGARVTAAGPSRRVRRGAARDRLGRSGVRLVAAAHVAPRRRSLADHLQPAGEIASQLGIAVVAVSLQRSQGGGILPRLEHEGAVGITRIERRVG